MGLRPDALFSGPDHPVDESVRRRFFGEDESQASAAARRRSRDAQIANGRPSATPKARPSLRRRSTAVVAIDWQGATNYAKS
jgi:hypothetical protein